MLQLFTDLHLVFTKNYLHCVDSDKILICEVHNATHHTAETLRDPSIQTLLADSLYNSLFTDKNQNVHALLNLKGSLHSITLNAKVGTRGNSLHKIKESLLKAKNKILECMAYNIASQNENGTLAGLMSAFDLSSIKEYDSHAQKISQLFICMVWTKTMRQINGMISKWNLLWKNVWIVQRMNYWNNSRKLLLKWMPWPYSSKKTKNWLR